MKRSTNVVVACSFKAEHNGPQHRHMDVNDIHEWIKTQFRHLGARKREEALWYLFYEGILVIQEDGTTVFNSAAKRVAQGSADLQINSIGNVPTQGPSSQCAIFSKLAFPDSVFK